LLAALVQTELSDQIAVRYGVDVLNYLGYVGIWVTFNEVDQSFLAAT